MKTRVSEAILSFSINPERFWSVWEGVWGVVVPGNTVMMVT
jgi:hypothetical protein